MMERSEYEKVKHLCPGIVFFAQSILTDQASKHWLGTDGQYNVWDFGNMISHAAEQRTVP